MSYPEDPQRWGQHERDGAQPPQEPVTGPTVSYNAAAFEDDETRVDQPVTPQSNQWDYPQQSYGEPQQGLAPQPPATGPLPPAPGPQYPVTGPQPPVTGPQYPVTGPQYPVTGSQYAPTGSYPDTGSYPTEVQPTAGGYPGADYSPEYSPGYATGAAPATAVQPAYGDQGYPPAVNAGGVSAFDPGTGSGKRSNKGLLIGVAALALVGALVAGYFVFFTFGGIQNSKGEIKNAASFLGEAESDWKAQLPEDGIKVSSQASCYYVLDDGDEVTGQIACGPARRASTPNGAVWDMYDYSVTGSGDSQTASELVAGETSQQAPGNGSLVTVEGEEPKDDGLGLEEPPLPKAPPQTVQMQDSFEVGEKSLGKENALVDSPMLIGPKAQVTLTSVHEATSATIDETLMAPAEGEKFYVVALEGTTGPVDQDASNSLELTVDGESTQVSGDPAGLGQTTFLVSVPEDAETTIDLVSEGHRQSLSLANGERSEDETASMYYSGAPEIYKSLSTTANLPETPTGSGENASMVFTFSGGWLYPYDEKLGWAPDGEVWLQLDFKDTGTSTAPDGSSVYSGYYLDCMASTFDVDATMNTCPGPSASAPILVASVPAGTTSFTLNLSATMKLNGPGVPEAVVNFSPTAVQISLA